MYVSLTINIIRIQLQCRFQKLILNIVISVYLYFAMFTYIIQQLNCAKYIYILYHIICKQTNIE